MENEKRVFGEKWIDYDNKNEDVTLYTSECQNCKKEWFPEKVVCPECFSFDLKQKELPEVGEIYSYTTLHVTSREFKAPLQIAYVDFPGDVRVCGQVEGDGLKTGMKVKPFFGQISQDPDGTSVYSYKFKPADQ